MSTGGTYYLDGVPECMQHLYEDRKPNHIVRPSNPDSMASYYSDR
jgi:hypothetical protein